MLEFPNNPTNGQIYQAPSGVTYVWSASEGTWTVPENLTPYSTAVFANYWVSSSTGYNLVKVGGVGVIYPQFKTPSALSQTYTTAAAGVFFGVDESGDIVGYDGSSEYAFSFSGGPEIPVKKFTVRNNATSALYERFVLYQNGDLYKNSSTNFYDSTGVLTFVDSDVYTINSIYGDNVVWTKTDGTLRYLGVAQLAASPFGTQTLETVGTMPVNLPSGRYVTTIIPHSNGAVNGNPSDGSLAVLLDNGTVYRWGDLGGTKAAPQLYSPVGVTFRSISGSSYGPAAGGGILAVSTDNQIYGFSTNLWTYLFGGSASSAAPMTLAGGTLNTTAYNAAFVGQNAGGQTVQSVVMLQGTDGLLYCATNKSGSTQVIKLQTSLASNTLNTSLFGFLPECCSMSIPATPGEGTGEWYGSVNWLFY